MTWLFFAILACGAHSPRTGLILDDEGEVLLVEESGRRWKLSVHGEARAIEQLLGCRVRLEGPAHGRRVKVKDWTVIDSGYGSTPYLGRLERRGANWIMSDRTTGSVLQFEVESMGKLVLHEGDLVLIDGVVLGPHLLRVVSFRILIDEANSGGAE